MFAELFKAVTGVSLDRASEWAMGKAREIGRGFICGCGHYVKLHAEPTSEHPRGGRCSGVTNAKPCECCDFVSMADRDAAKTK